MALHLARESGAVVEQTHRVIVHRPDAAQTKRDPTVEMRSNRRSALARDGDIANKE